MRTRVFLSASDYQLVGKYFSQAEHIHVVLDSVIPFTVTLPDLKLQENREFIFYNIPSSGAGNSVVVQAVTGQLINGKDTSHTLIAYDSATFVSDMRSSWLLSDTNQ